MLTFHYRVPYLYAMEVLPTDHFQPDIVVNGLRIGEPMIALTGLLISLVCFYSWVRLGRIAEKDDVLKLTRIFFLLMSISTLIGALVGHCFLYCLPFAFKTPGWLLGMISISALEQASIERVKPIVGEGWGRALKWFNIGSLILGMCFVVSTLWFPGVEIHSAVSLLGVVVPLEILLWLKYQNPGSRLLLAGVLFLVAGVLVHIFKFSLSIWFGYFDIAHLLMCGAFWYFLLGAEANSNKLPFIQND